MFDIQGRFAKATVYAKELDPATYAQILILCNQEFAEGSSIKIMPDAHAGKGCTIGTTMTIKDKIVPNLVGVDIGCGMLTLNIGDANVNLDVFDNFIHKNIPSGHNIHDKAPRVLEKLNQLRCLRHMRGGLDFFNKSLGSLGGGNHFIEMDIDDKGNKYIVIHSGSRNLGKQIAEYYQKIAYDKLTELGEDYAIAVKQLTEELTAQGKRKQIADAILNLRREFKKDVKVPRDLAYVQGTDFADYIHDMKIAQEYASANRFTILYLICKAFDLLHHQDLFETVHNYIDMESMILRKGAISAPAEKRVLIPLNMRDGSILAIGKGNPDWNSSGPHGAGRLMSRHEAKEKLDMADFKKAMEGIHTSCVKKDTLDEAPMAYKPAEEIIEAVGDTVDIQCIIKPIYNFKASE